MSQKKKRNPHFIVTFPVVEALIIGSITAHAWSQSSLVTGGSRVTSLDGFEIGFCDISFNFSVLMWFGRFKEVKSVS